ncbi:MAG: copper chaperone PCu(A)C [Flaviflexus sp.]|nr:copper chaperone PCu(A)C [Flaviflexus sp.]
MRARTFTTGSRLLACLGAAALALAGCSSSDEAEPEEVASVQEEGGLTFTDMWTKAVEGDMTGSFGTITNTTDEDIVVESATYEGAGLVQLHETVEKDGKMLMQEMTHDFVVPAGGSYELQPGGDHIMLMKLDGPLASGDIITITLNLRDGDPIEFTSDVRTYTGAKEEYGVHGESEEMDHDKMDQEDHEGHDMDHHDGGEDEGEDGQ